MRPKRDKDILEIFDLAEEKNSSDSESCLQAVKSMYQLRSQAREKLKDILKSLEVSHDETIFDVMIEKLNIEFKIYKIQSIAESEVEFKYLYKLHDLENLSLGELNG